MMLLRHCWCLVLPLLFWAAPAAAEYERMTRIIHEQKSMYRNIVVAQGGSVRCMSFGKRHGRQTCVDLAAPERLVLLYTQGLLAALFVEPRPRRVLVIGLGGGAIPMALRAIDPAVHVDAVEVDPAVAEVARRFFGLREDPHLRVHVEDGRVFVRQQLRERAVYDLVVIDAFERTWAPEHLQTVEFFRQVEQLLAPGGVLAANTYASGPLQQHEAATYQAVFGALVQLDMGMGNRILLARRGGLPPLAELRARGIQLHARLAPFGVVAEALATGLQPTPRSDARVMTDQYAPVNLLFGESW